MTKISVVVSIRDCGERIIEALESISAQTYPRDNVETIVVDHGSTDMSPALARRFMARHGMQGSVFPIDGDIWAAFDAGWHQVDGQWVQFLKGQDLLAPTHLEVLAKAIAEADEAVQVACSSWQCLYANGNAGPVCQAGIGGGSILQLISPHTWTLGAALYRKSAIEAVGGFGEGMLFATAERFMLRIAGVGERIRLRHKPFLDVPSSSPMFFEYSDPSQASNRTASVEEHLENILLARLALIERANGDIGADETETLAAVCEESLRDLLNHDRRAFIRCYEKLHDVDPRLVSAPAIAAAGARTSSGTAIADRFALTIPSWRQARQGRPETALDIVRHQPATPRFPIKLALIATAVVAGIAVVPLGTKVTTTLIATARDGKPEQVVEKPGVVVPKINVASANYVELGSPWPMPIEISPKSAVPSRSVLHLRGLPPTVTLSEGSRVSADTWVVPIASLPNLDLVAAYGAKGKSEISLSLVTNDGRVLAQARSAILIAEEPTAPPVAVAQEVARTAAAPTTVTPVAPAAPPASEFRASIKPADMQDAPPEKTMPPAKPERPSAAGQSPRAKADLPQASKHAVAREAARKAAEAKKAEEEREAAEAARKAEEARRLAEAKAAEEARKAEAARKAAEAKKAEEEREAAEVARKEIGRAHV